MGSEVNLFRIHWQVPMPPAIPWFSQTGESATASTKRMKGFRVRLQGR